MERLSKDLKAMIIDVRAKSGNPSVEVLTAYVTRLSNAILRDASSLPTRILQMCRESFAMMGWDIRSLQITNADDFTASKLLECLDQLALDIASFSDVVFPTADELADLSKACIKLWDLDQNRLVPDRDYRINLQQGKKMYEKFDAAKDPLFAFIDEAVFERPTYRTFLRLLDNYVAEVGVTEGVSREELKENSVFLDYIMDTACLKYLHQYLLAKRVLATADPNAFKSFLNVLWFKLYSRKATNDSSGFEHVFLGEIKEDGQVSGLHNWIQLYKEEKAGRLDYRGFLKPKAKPSRGYMPEGHVVPDENDQLITLQFSWNDHLKPVSTSFIGTSPEFEIALYTMCFCIGAESNDVFVGPYKVKIVCFNWTTKKGEKMIASCFPEQESFH